MTERTYAELVAHIMRKHPDWDEWMATLAADEGYETNAPILDSYVTTRDDIEQTRLNLKTREYAREIVDRVPALMAMIEAKIYEIDHPWRTRFRKLWMALRSSR